MRHVVRAGRRRLGVIGVLTAVLAALGLGVLALPGSPQAALPGASVTVCQVTGSASAPNYAQVDVSADQVAAYLNQYPGSFIGSCPSGGSGGGGTGGTGGTPANGAVTVCSVTGSASVPNFALATVALNNLGAYLNQNPGSFVGTCPGSGSPAGSPGPLPNGFVTLCSLTGSLAAPHYAQVTVALTDLQAALNRQPGSFAGACPTAGDLNGNPGPVPSGFATICRITGDATTPYATLTVAASQLGTYLNQAGNVLSAPGGGCPTALPADGGTVAGGSGPGSEPGDSPGTSNPGSSSTIVVQTTPNTVVTATGAGTNSTSKSDAAGKATLSVKPRHKGIVSIRGAGGKVIKRIGVLGKQSGAQLTG
jgi:hypothetical protein